VQLAVLSPFVRPSLLNNYCFFKLRLVVVPGGGGGAPQFAALDEGSSSHHQPLCTGSHDARVATKTAPHPWREATSCPSSIGQQLPRPLWSNSKHGLQVDVPASIGCYICHVTTFMFLIYLCLFLFSPRAFQASYSSPNQVLQCMSGHLPQEPIGLQPIKVAIENLAGRKESGYKFSPLDQPHLMLPGGMSTTTAGEGQRLEGVLEAAAEAAGRQVAAVESHCDDILRQIKAMCHKVGCSVFSALLGMTWCGTTSLN